MTTPMQQTTNSHVFRVIVRENKRTVRSFTVLPSGSELVAVSPKTLRTGQGPVEPFSYVDYDVAIGSVRYRITGREGQDFFAVPWEEGMDG